MATPMPSVPFSALLREKASSNNEPQKKSREDYKKAKELEEARKAGTAPAAVDESGRDINPHIPQYISTAPWYFGAKGATLKHQRVQSEKQKQVARVGEWYVKGIDTTKIATKYRKGACENCGAMGHTKKNCLERPRINGAKFTGRNIAPDEILPGELALDFEGKRDRWNAYDPSEYQAVIDEHKKMEEAKRAMKAERLEKGQEDTDEDSDEDDDKYADSVDMPGTKVDSKQRITVRNLRIREDTAKYLRNLDPESAYYDPKTRSMRENPYETTGRSHEEVDYAGENFVRFSGDTVSHAQTQMFAWEAHKSGIDVNLLAEPTKIEALKREFMVKKEEIKKGIQHGILERYGGKEHLQAPPKELLLAQTEQYVEYSRSGKIIKGGEKQVIRSRYEEDVFVNNHTTVWGSWWNSGQWGYKCCHSMVKNSYCTGVAGIAASGNLLTLPPPSEVMPPKSPVPFSKEETKKKVSRRKRRESTSSSSSSSSESSSASSSSETSDDEEEIKKKRLKLAIEKEEKDTEIELDERKRKYNSKYEAKAPTEEEMEAYRMKRKHFEDPMTDFM
ncbi:pre-mRNA-splicing factor SLU7-like [Artemia franciscana]|uniref:Pre-mRNA-splicing factor SLU7 n=1 Tax=Artemia franciscana TaxID=6661 RepID=A0AA88HK76_ARTSF|nr:hypothetical protein QYM36_015033 [Artemia franciscana]